MKLHRFFINPSHINDSRVTLPEELSKQAIKVLRLRRGDQFIVLDNKGSEYVVELDIPDSKQVSAKIIEQRKNISEPQTQITLYQSLLPREKFELALQKSVEVGISKFVPTKTTYTIYGKDSVTEQKLERWRSVIRETAEQSERGILPEITPALDLIEAINQALQKGLVLLAHPYQSDRLSNIINESAQSKSISIFIGPEGGFTDEEIKYAISQDASIISLGKRILRSETAGPILAALILYEKKDF